jgi:molecular chaperone DnaK
MKGEDKAAIESRTQALAEASSKMAERVYAQAGTEAGAPGAGAEAKKPGDGGDNVVDAEFEEVKDDKK